MRGDLSLHGEVPGLREKVKRQIRNAKRAKNQTPPVPNSLEEIDFISNPTYTLTYDSKHTFLIYDSGPEAKNNRLLIFGTFDFMYNLRYADNETWYADGTFKVTPKIGPKKDDRFYQLYTIHAVVHGVSLPFAYALMPNKSSKSYKTVLLKVLEHAGDYKPQYLMTDYEMGIKKAAKEVLPTTRHRGCYFHFIQSCTRKIKEDKKISDQFTKDKTYSVKVRHLMALAFVPEDRVEAMFTELIQSRYIPADAAPFVKYFEKYYIGKRDRQTGRRTIPRFPPTMWNCFDLARDKGRKTNNSMEGWHNKFQRMFGCWHPDVWSFIKTLQTHQFNAEAAFREAATNFAPPQKSSKQQEKEQRLAVAVAAFPRDGTMKDQMKHLYRLACLIGTVTNLRDVDRTDLELAGQSIDGHSFESNNSRITRSMNRSQNASVIIG
jgi:hypothetical protein